jgi:hypothetical protein
MVVKRGHVSSGEADAAQWGTGLIVDYNRGAVTCNTATEVEVQEYWLGYTVVEQNGTIGFIQWS